MGDNNRNNLEKCAIKIQMLQGKVPDSKIFYECLKTAKNHQGDRGVVIDLVAFMNGVEDN